MPHRDLQFARLLVVVATVASFLALSMPWYADGGTNSGERFDSLSGWGLFGELTKDTDGTYVFAGCFSLAVVVLSLLAGAAVLQVRLRWFCGVLSTLLAVEAVGLYLVILQFDDDLRAEQLAGTWAGLAILLFSSVAWGTLAGALREAAYEDA